MPRACGAGPRRESGTLATQRCDNARMSWDDVRVFLAVARARSLARGAREAGLDRSTASRRIAALEADLGARLFLRTREGLRLSPAGTRLVERAERMASEARAMAAEAAEAFGEVTGTVRVATTEALGVLLVEEGLLDLPLPLPRGIRGTCPRPRAARRA